MYGKCMCEYAKKLRFIVLFHISYFANRFVFLFAAKILHSRQIQITFLTLFQSERKLDKKCNAV